SCRRCRAWPRPSAATRAAISSRQPWERRPNETAKAHQAFSVYRGLDPQARSLDAAYRRYRGDKRATKGPQRAPGYFARWSIRHNWVNRAAAWDDHLEAERLWQDRNVWLARQKELRETEWSVASQLID